MVDGHPLTAWHDPTWVLAVMHYPGETVVLDRIANGNFETLARRNVWRAEMDQAARRGIVAGHVLMTLYGLAVSPWSIPEPSLAKAIYATEKFAYVEKYKDGAAMPRGSTEVRACFDAMRPVAHLWAARRLHDEYPTCPRDELISTADGIRTLLGIARGVQNFALTWKPARTRGHVPLLGNEPWLIPESIAPLHAPWKHEPDWLLKTVAAYKRKAK